jgi:nucleotide-binding universal stress UspA family protein
MTRIVVLAYDGSDSARPALERVAAMPPGEVAITVVCAVETLIRSRVPHGPVVDPIVEEQRHQALEQARSELEQRGHQVQLLEGVGDPASCTLEVAKTTKADLVVVGSHHHGLAERALHGSVSTKLAHECPCDLLIARNGPVAAH